MNNINRRNFLKNCGIGMGMFVASGSLVEALFAKGASNAEVNEKIFGLSTEDIKKLLEIGLSKGGDFSELYFEFSVSNSVMMQEDIIKSSSESITLGVGVRVIKGAQTGFGYTNELTFDKIKNVVLTAAAIANSPKSTVISGMLPKDPVRQVYTMDNLISDQKLETKIDLIKSAYSAAQNYDNKIKKVTASIADSFSLITIANSEGLLISDRRPQVRLMVNATAEDNGVRNTGVGNDGGRIGLDFYKTQSTPEQIGKKAAHEAITLLTAKNAPAGELPIILNKNYSGVMVHEAVGHPLEADGAWKKTSIMWDKMGQKVASPIVTIYDDATIPNLRGSLNIDDEGTPTENVVLIEKGKLVGFLNDKLAAKQLKTKPNGHGRRESYANNPIPRMNNTVLAPGEYTPEEIIKSCKKGFFADTFQGGMVDSTGKFTFSVNLGYLVEDGKLTQPLKNATLIGSNIEVLNNIDMIGNDMGFFLGTCGKDGQSVPVTCGTPTFRISKMTVGGEA